MIIMLVAVTLVIGGMIGFKYMIAAGTKKAMTSMPEPAQTVSTMKAESLPWAQTLTAVGTLRAVNGADIAAEVAGIVESIAFDSGADVEKDATLVHLRDDDETAKLKSLEASLRLAELTLERDQKQLKAQAVSQATIDADIATLNAAKAAVEEQRAVIAKKTIRAPFAGHVGIRQIDVGQYVAAGTMLVTLQQLDPIYIDFTVPERDLPKLAVGQKVVAKADALRDQTFEGEIAAIDAKIDEATRNAQVRALFKNAERKLMPGMFAHVDVTVGEPVAQITVPQTALTYNPYGNTVFRVVRDEAGKTKAEQSFVTTGPARGDQIAILSGIKDGDEIVSSGQLKLRNGTPIAINNDVQPRNDANPQLEQK
jgi:membrane fusion protein (multidrug efflux system)